VCIEDLDHHCPWSSKCIGGGNIKAFYVFLFSFTLQLVVLFVIGFIVFGDESEVEPAKVYHSYDDIKSAAQKAGGH